jgi:hypothetical protein
MRSLSLDVHGSIFTNIFGDFEMLNETARI